MRESLARLKLRRVVMVEPGEWSVREEICAAIESVALPLEVCEDRHFLGSHAEFAAHAAARKQLQLEFFYREMRKRHNVLMDDGKPAGGAWNFDSENRKSFGKAPNGERKLSMNLNVAIICAGILGVDNGKYQNVTVGPSRTSNHRKGYGRLP